MGLNALIPVMLSWQETKLFLQHSIAFSTDSVHVIASVLIMLGAALLLRKPLSSSTPWLVVLAFACLNEFVDLFVQLWAHPGRQYGESAKDLMLTMVLPTVLLIAFRHFPRLGQPPAPAPPPP